MPPKGVSEAEKLAKIVDFVTRSGAVFSSSTLEQIAKACKISNMQIKGFVQEVTDEGLINSDKIGAGTFYWKFPSEESQKLASELEELEKEKALIQKDISDLDVELKKFELKFAASEDVTKEHQELKELNNQYKTLLHKEALASKNSPQLYEQIQVQTEEAKTAANIETDNLFNIVSYLKKSLNIENGAIKEIIEGWKDDFDYIE